MYKVHNNLVPILYTRALFMRDISLNNTATNLRSVTISFHIVSQTKCNLFKGSLSFSGVVLVCLVASKH